MKKIFSLEQGFFLYDPESMGIYQVNDEKAEYTLELDNQTDDLEQPNQTQINELVFLTSQKCNLSCNYCYASAINSANRLMPYSVFFRIIQDCFSNPAFQIERIIFIGGEPFLNREPLLKGINTLRDQFGYQGTIGIVSNGTSILDSDIPNLAAQRIDITLSIDGPEFIHDQLRKYKDGRGSFLKVISTLDRLISTGIPAGVEGTYTNLHVRMNYGLEDLLSFYLDLGVRNIHVAIDLNINNNGELSSDFADRLSLFWLKGINYSLQSLLTSNPIYFKSIMPYFESLILKKKAPNYCKAGIKTIAFYADEKIFPCYFFEQNSLDHHLLKTNSCVQNWIHHNQELTKKNEECSTCWIHQTCTNCIGLMDQSDGRIKPDPFFCEIQRTTTEAVIKFIIQVIANNQLGYIAKSLENLYDKYHIKFKK